MTPVALGVFHGEPPFLPAPSLCPRKCGGPGQELPPCAGRISSGKDLLTCSSPLTQVTTSNLLWAAGSLGGTAGGRRGQRQGRPSACGWGARSERALEAGDPRRQHVVPLSPLTWERGCFPDSWTNT